MIVLKPSQETLLIERLNTPIGTGGTLIFRSRLTAVFGAPGVRKNTATVARKFGEALERKGVQVGLRIARGQSVSLAVDGARVVVDPKVSSALERAFSRSPGERWVGFSVSYAKRAGAKRKSKPRGSPGSILTTLKLRGLRRRPALAFQLMPIVLAFREQSFETHHLMGISVLHTRRSIVNSRIDTIVKR